MVVIRLGRQGSKHNPKYRITVADSRRSPTGRFIEKLGTYDPQVKDLRKGLYLNSKRVEYWIKTGAKPSQRVQNLIRVTNEINKGTYEIKQKRKKQVKQKRKKDSSAEKVTPK